ncbi:transposase [Poseidonocella sp. HB161398]|uniref:transposase n=1 Tax=Poseidonocella sp. HB161398 TaxID=2320855 RepID=UPI00110996F9|nr:transposase [Poseidonocella sp. HB161398]
MAGFIEGAGRQQAMLFPETLDDYVGEANPVQVVDAFVEMLDPAALGFRTAAKETGRPEYHPGLMLRIYVYGYLNRIQSSRRLETECGRNLELIWLTTRLRPDFKTLADFPKAFEGSDIDPVDRCPRERRGDPQGLPAIHPVLPRHEPARRRHGRDRRQPVQGRECQVEKLHAGEIAAQDEGHRRRHCPLHGRAGPR